MADQPGYLHTKFSGNLLQAGNRVERGKDLADDPQYQERLAAPHTREYMFDETVTSLCKELPKSAKLSAGLFSCALILIGLIALFPDLLPAYGEPAKTASMSLVIQIVMPFIGGIRLPTCKVKPTDVAQGTVFQAGMVTVVALYTLYSNTAKQVLK